MVRELIELMRRKLQAQTPRPDADRLQENIRSLEQRFEERTRELQRVNRELEQERTRLSAVIEMAMDAIITMDERQNILVFNRAAEAMFGYDAGEVTGKPLAMLMPERFRMGHGGLVREFGRTALTSRRMGATNAIIALRRDGEEFPIEASISRMEVADSLYFTVIIRDISARVRAEASLRWFAGIVTSSGDAIISESLDGRVTSWNDAAEALLGWSADEMIGQSLQRVIPHEFAGLGEQARERLRQGETVGPIDTSRVRRDGSMVEVSVTLSPIRDQKGDVTGYSAITRDITERRRMEGNLQVAFREQATLLKEVYHRVKNNLQVVSSLFNLQLRKLPEGQARTALEESANRVRSMALVHEMLYQSQDLSSIDLSRYIEDLCSQLSMAHNAAPRGIRFVTEGERVLVPLDQAVPLGLSLNELVSNSLKHAFPNGRAGTIRVRLHRLAEGRAALEVSDDGVGFESGAEGVRQDALGLQLVTSLGRQLNATLTTRSQGGASTRLEFSVDAEKLAQAQNFGAS